MIDNFVKIPEEEQRRILEVILREFAEKGYLRASTNLIVQKAGIPKGTLFYYFGSKKAMYLYALDWAVARFIKMNKSLPADQPEDLFENLLYRSEVKFQFIRKEPLLYKFLYKAFLDIPPELNEDMDSRFAEYSKASQTLAFENIDRSKFREDVNVESAIRMIHLMLDGLLNSYLPRLGKTTPEEALGLVNAFETECLEYFRMIKAGIYL